MPPNELSVHGLAPRELNYDNNQLFHNFGPSKLKKMPISKLRDSNGHHKTGLDDFIVIKS